MKILTILKRTITFAVLGLIQKNAWSLPTKGKLKFLAIPITGADLDVPRVSDTLWNTHFETVSSHLKRSSGGELSVKFTRYPLQRSDDYTKEDCIRRTCSKKFMTLSYNLVKKNKIPLNDYDALVFYHMGGCSCYRYVGFAATCNAAAWLRGTYLGNVNYAAGVAAHEIGHLMCLGHDGGSKGEYGNRYTPMGIPDGSLTENQYLAGAKVHLNWIDARSQKLFAKNSSSSGKRTVFLNVHNSDSTKNGYKNSDTYVACSEIKGSSKVSMCVESRRYGGNTIVLAYYQYKNGIRYSKTYLVDYTPYSKNTMDENIPEGGVVVLAPQTTGWMVKVLKVRSSGASVELSYVDSENKRDYSQGLQVLKSGKGGGNWEMNRLKRLNSTKIMYLSTGNSSYDTLRVKLSSCSMDAYVFTAFPRSSYPYRDTNLRVFGSCGRLDPPIYETHFGPVGIGGSSEKFVNRSRFVYVILREKSRIFTKNEKEDPYISLNIT